MTLKCVGVGHCPYESCPRHLKLSVSLVNSMQIVCSELVVCGGIPQDFVEGALENFRYAELPCYEYDLLGRRQRESCEPLEIWRPYFLQKLLGESRQAFARQRARSPEHSRDRL